MGLWRRWSSTASQLEELIRQHVELVEGAVGKFAETLFTYLDRGNLEEACKLVEETHRMESQADDVRRQAAKQLVRGALLPTTRAEMLELIERVDKVANLTESFLYFTLLQGIKVPEELIPTAKEITERIKEMMAKAKTAVQLLFADRERALEHCERIEQLESQVDRTEKEAIRRIFVLELELAEKILLREFINRLADISDRIEDLSDQVELIVATRKL